MIFKKFELVSEKKHTDPAEKAFISTLCLLNEEKVEQALMMARKAVKEGLPFERFLGEPREWLKPLREMKEFSRWEISLNPSALLHGPMVGQVTDLTASFWFRTDGPCEIEVEITGHSGREKITTSKEEGIS